MRAPGEIELKCRGQGPCLAACPGSRAIQDLPSTMVQEGGQRLALPCRTPRAFISRLRPAMQHQPTAAPPEPCRHTHTPRRPFMEQQVIGEEEDMAAGMATSIS